MTLASSADLSGGPAFHLGHCLLLSICGWNSLWGPWLHPSWAFGSETSQALGLA